MATIDLSQFAVGGATRPDSFSGLDPAFLQSLQSMFAAAPPEIQQNLRVLSGFRSNDRQSQLWEQALAKYGSPERARKWVAPPGSSKHNHGSAVDLRYLDPQATEWAHQNARNFGLHFPLDHENWHIEPIGSRGGQKPQMVAQNAPQAAGSSAPAMPPAREVADLPVAAVGPGQNMPVPAGPEGGAAPESGFSSVLSAFGKALSANMPAQGAQMAGPSVSHGSAAPMQATMAAQQGAERARGLKQGLMPDVASLMGLGKRPVSVVG